MGGSSSQPSVWTERMGPDAEMQDMAARKESFQTREDKHLVWQTSSVPGGLGEPKIFKCPAREADAATKATWEEESVAGKVRLCAVLPVGDKLNGHPGIVHGGFSAALLDELFAWTVFLEKDAHGFGSKTMLTANLTLNYKAPVFCNREYMVEVEAERMVKSKKIFLKAVVLDTKGQVCVDATSLYILRE
eukprot:CAMPEP_0179053734 /NCGR_PEP_ID=MMETSP0796-20121207/22426_1 /TAXON_ID=73915 /ORGANISM="Pyrodinium bahamense, Strain pbaha01" /LENGTH=189 /DNA_ID=CAMNT_0020750341 /DNA_START=49 /DNA_END=618 /DNA_ORIENTATION=+